MYSIMLRFWRGKNLKILKLYKYIIKFVFLNFLNYRDLDGPIRLPIIDKYKD